LDGYTQVNETTQTAIALYFFGVLHGGNHISFTDSGDTNAIHIDLYTTTPTNYQ